MIDLTQYIGTKYKVSKEASYRNGGDLPDHHYDQIKGRRGDIMAWDDELIEVTVLGKKLPEPPPGVLPDKTHNLVLPMTCEKKGWKVNSRYDDSYVFLLPKDRIFEAIKVIKAKKQRQVTEAMRQKGRDLQARMRSSKISPVPRVGLATESQETVVSPIPEAKP